MAFSGTWKKESVTGGEAFFKAYDPKPENLEKLAKAAAAEMITEMTDNGATLKLVRTLKADGESKVVSDNLITFGQESDLTGPLGNTFKVVIARDGDKCTATVRDISITMEIAGGKFVETYSGKGNTMIRTSSK